MCVWRYGRVYICIWMVLKWKKSNVRLKENWRRVDDDCYLNHLHLFIYIYKKRLKKIEIKSTSCLDEKPNWQCPNRGAQRRWFFIPCYRNHVSIIIYNQTLNSLVFFSSQNKYFFLIDLFKYYLFLFFEVFKYYLFQELIFLFSSYFIYFIYSRINKKIPCESLFL